MRPVILLALVALLLGACDWGGGVPAAQGTLTPGSAGVAGADGGTRTPGTPPPLVRACAVSDLGAIAGYQGATGSMAGAVRFTNKSTTPCMLVGRPGIHLVGAKGNLLPVANIDGKLESTPSNSAAFVILQPGNTAFAFFVWRNWCGKAAGPYSLAVALPGEGGQLTIPALDPAGNPLSETPRCDESNASSVITINPFEQRR